MAKIGLTWHGHACFSIDMGTKIIVDPFLNGNPLADIKPSQVKADVVVVTHAHSDHLGDAIEICKANSAELVTMVELAWSLSEKNDWLKAHDINISGSTTVKGVKISAVPAHHSSSFDGGSYAGPPMGVVIGNNFRIYHAGDTGIVKDMEVLGDYYKPQVSLLPIGGHYTMGPEEAAYATGMIRSRYTIPMHYNTFDKIKADPMLFSKLVKERGSSEVIVAQVGKELVFDEGGKRLE